MWHSRRTCTHNNLSYTCSFISEKLNNVELLQSIYCTFYLYNWSDLWPDLGQSHSQQD